MVSRSLYDENGRPIKKRKGFSSGSDYTHKSRKVLHTNHKDNLKDDEVKYTGVQAPDAPIVYDSETIADSQGYLVLSIFSFFFGIFGIPFGIYVIRSLGKKKILSPVERFASGFAKFSVTVHSIVLIILFIGIASLF